MIYEYNQTVSVKALSDLRESIGWNRMENEYNNTLMTSYYHTIAKKKRQRLLVYARRWFGIRRDC